MYVSEERIEKIDVSSYDHLFHEPVSLPTALYYIGPNFDDLLTFDRVAVVGSRDVTEEGKSAAFELGANLAKKASVVISGLALGIDTAAFEGAISEGGRCVAILPSGLKQIVPRSNNGLAEQIVFKIANSRSCTKGAAHHINVLGSAIMVNVQDVGQPTSGHGPKQLS